MHLVMGGALLMPYWLLSMLLLSTLVGGIRSGQQVLGVQFGALATALPLAWATALLPATRVLIGTPVRALFPELAGELAAGPSVDWTARRRTATWFALHLLLGGVVSGMSLSIPAAVAVLWMRPAAAFAGAGLGGVRHWYGGDRPAGAALGAALLVLLLAVSAGAGALLARCAPALLGPTPTERLAVAEQRALVLAQRNRLARELHDSVGHALSAVSIQAAAAARVLRTDPEFAAEALGAIEQVAREAVAELDTVLGVLREDAEAPTASGGPTLAALDSLLRQLALAGLPVETALGPDLARLPEPVSREAYRIVQEGLTNVLRHAGPVPARLRLELQEGRLDVELTNPIGSARPVRTGGGRGLRGVAERAAALHGGCESGRTADGLGWRLAVWLPVAGAA
ncbi:sensor histidine kinase [Kitasatospora sp. MAP12-15]|uniref:sensor histidine kinase n=1 Tax=unclassified Kitasatospora TaxID=2633591 RepID=UPI003D1AC96E